MRARAIQIGIALLGLSLGVAARSSAQFAAPEGRGNPRASAPESDPKVSVDFKQTPFGTAVDMLFSGTGLFYMISPGVENTPVTLKVRDIALSQALRLLVRQAATVNEGLTYEYSEDIYRISRKPKPDGVTLHIPRRFRAESAATGAAGGWTKIALRHVSAAKFGELFGATVIKSTGEAGDARVGASSLERTGWIVPEGIEGILAISADNSLIVRGTSEGTRAMSELVELIDVAQPRTTLVLSAGALRAETSLGLSEEVSVLDSDGVDRLEAKMSFQRSAGALVVSVDGLVRVNGRSRSIKTRRTVISGVPTAIAAVTGPKGPVTLYLRATDSPPMSGHFDFGGGPFPGFGGQ